jgi:hypothetical protein
MKIKYVFLLLVACFIISCDNKTKGVDQDFILDEFSFPSSANPTVIDLIDEGTCPVIVFDSTDTENFKVQIDDENPIEAQSTFAYADTEFENFRDVKTLTATNESGSTMSLSYDGDTYTLDVDYNCDLPGQTDECTNTSYVCTGVIQ